MYARWATFAVGLGLILSPLVLGYRSAGMVLHDVALGLIVCVAAVVSLAWPPVRFAIAAPAAWLLATGRDRADPAAASPALAAGAILLVLTLIPSSRLAPTLPRSGARA